MNSTCTFAESLMKDLVYSSMYKIVVLLALISVNLRLHHQILLKLIIYLPCMVTWFPVLTAAIPCTLWAGYV